ncbi:MAG TPA: SDR family NAD(P)-dependent oxidoreductase [Solirubrobacteraceae bacterium]|nr:SDR family NAD(P)-dependent oxidoreductase [Solirubrobacteraceae bacterium]
MEELEGRVAVVTGAASGIGLGLARRFAQEGMRVVLADIEDEPLEAAVEELRGGGAEAIGVATDVSDGAAVEALAQATIDRFGAVHVVCNNAGVESGARFADIPVATWEWVLGVNLWGVLHGCRVFLPLIREQGEGHIVNTASLAALATGLATFAPYTTSKFAILAASECLELELLAAGERIGVSVLCPGVVTTNMCDAERNRPAEVPSTADDPLRQTIIGRLRELSVEVGMDPARVAEMVVDAIRTRRFFVLTHPDEAFKALERRAEWMRTGVAPGERSPGRADASAR